MQKFNPKKVIQKRRLKYSNFKKYISKSKTGLIYEYQIDKKDLQSFQNLVIKFVQLNFLKHKIEFKNKSFNNLLKNLDTLSTYTHNGVLKPKKETIRNYNQIVNRVLNYLNKMSFKKSIKYITLPNVRIIRENKKLKNKNLSPRDTRIPHCDVWAGQNGSGIFNLGIFGDFKKSSIKYYDILNFKRNYLNKQNNFLMAKKNIVKKKYFSQLKLGRSIYFDMIVPHNTFSKPLGKNRISIDFCISLNDFSKKNNYNYYRYNFFKDKIRDFKLGCKLSIDDSKKNKFKTNDGLYFL